MKAGKWVGLGILVSLAVLVVGLTGGGWFWSRVFWRMPVMAASLAQNSSEFALGCGGSGFSSGPGMMRGGGPAISCGTGANITPRTGLAIGAVETCPMIANFAPLSGEGEMLTLAEAQAASEDYVASLGYANLEIVDLMEFERNFYAIARETASGIGAMELLVNKWTGAVGPEMGPNMMWNTKYGMHQRGGMMGIRTTIRENTLSETEARTFAEAWLDTYRPGVTVEAHADPFYGYYTFHTLADDTIEGMLSVHGNTGQVWYHTWHGQFIQMLDKE